MKHTLTLLAALLLAPLVSQAEVTGRIVRLEAPASYSMGIYEIEVWSGGKNVALLNKELTFAGVSDRGRDINLRKEGLRLIDGRADFNQRGNATGMECTMADVEAVNPWVEIDFGSDASLEKIVINQPLKPLYRDRAIRLVTVLDAQRRVVWSRVYDLRQAPCVKGVAALGLLPNKDSLTARTIPAGAAQWVPLADVLEPKAATAPPNATERAARFANRHSPEAIAQLAKEFFSRMDLSKSELAGVRAKYKQREFSAALDAYRDHFLAKMQRIGFMHEWPMVQTPYAAAAEDLLRGIAVIFATVDAVGQRFTPGAIDWAAIPDAGRGSVDLARVRTRAGQMQRPLLDAFRSSGRAEFLTQWAAISDDWGMNIRGDLARADADLRFYFVKTELQEFNHLADELGRTAKAQPSFATQLSGATLARLLIPVLEEYPPAYWWVCRRSSFNHTYNALNAATITSRILDDFHAGQRIDKENQQHWERVWSTMMTQDGSMNEIYDEGHLFMQLRMGAFFQQMKQTPPPWFTPDFAAEFETGWRQTTAYPFRHLNPDGRGHRFTRRDQLDYLWNIIEGKGDGYYGTDREQRDAVALQPPAEVISILQSVFGAGRDRATLPQARQELWDKVTTRFGMTWTPPTTLSDWMPYAGLHYLRSGWKPDAMFIHMLSQPKRHPSINGSDWNTEIHLFDHGQPMLACSPVWIDGQPPFNEAGTLTYKPGSKTETLATASERPIPARWHTSAFCDYAEAFYEGTYQRHAVQLDRDFRSSESKVILSDTPIEDARAERRVIMLRPAGLVIITDAVLAPQGKQQRRFELRQRFAIPETEATLTGADKKGVPGKFTGEANALTLINDKPPGVSVHRFSKTKLTWTPRNTPDIWDGAAMINQQGLMDNLGGVLRADATDKLLMSALVETQARSGESRIASTRDLSGDDLTGFTATLKDGSTLTWLATLGESRALTADRIQVEGEALLVWQSKGETTGLVLGAESLKLAGRQLALPSWDFEFTMKNGQLANTTAIHRPIEPVTFSPKESVFIDRTQITLATTTPGVEIRYTLDGKEPDASSPLYTAPIVIDKDCYIRARAFRPGVKTIPFTTAGIDVTVIRDARFHRRDLKPAAPLTGLKPGLRWELVEANWFSLFSHLHLPEVMPAKTSGETPKLLDVAMRQNDGPFGLRYSGYLDVPSDGVYTFHAPPEYIGAACEPGYDLRVWIDDEEWHLGQRFHGQGIWSVPLAKGAHKLLVTFADARHRDRTVHAPGLWRGYPTPWVVWKGEAPAIEISGPDFIKQPMPDAWLRREK